MSDQEAAVAEFERVGFRVVRRTSALVFLVHPEYPGLLVRVGTVFVVAERDGVEQARQRLETLDVETLLGRAKEQRTEPME